MTPFWCSAQPTTTLEQIQEAVSDRPKGAEIEFLSIGSGRQSMGTTPGHSHPENYIKF